MKYWYPMVEKPTGVTSATRKLNNQDVARKALLASLLNIFDWAVCIYVYVPVEMAVIGTR